MVNISKNFLITMNSGDTLKVPLLINVGDKLNIKPYFLKGKDKVYVAIKEPNQPFDLALVRKIYTLEDLDDKGRVVINLDPEDTEYILPGTYYMEIKMELSNGNFSTILPSRKMTFI